MKNSFKPTARTITSVKTASKKLPISTVNVTAALWDLMLLEGIAMLSTTAPLISGTVVFWLSSNQATSVNGADAITFTDNAGHYAVTVQAGRGYKVKLYS